MNQVPMGRSASADEAAEAVRFCARASYLTGQVIGINGGIVSITQTLRSGEMANRDEVVDALKATLVDRLKVEASTITEEANLFEDLGLDSIDLMTVVMAVEEKFAIEVSDEELEDVTTLGQAADLLSRQGRYQCLTSAA